MREKVFFKGSGVGDSAEFVSRFVLSQTSRSVQDAD